MRSEVCERIDEAAQPRSAPIIQPSAAETPVTTAWMCQARGSSVGQSDAHPNRIASDAATTCGGRRQNGRRTGADGTVARSYIRRRP